MTGKIPRYFIDDLLTRVDIVDLIDKHVPLKKTGANYTARCPFHSEKTPSFSVNRNKQFFHCFGCGVSGNAIGFLMDFNHLDFVEAVEDLATFAGLAVPRETNGHTHSEPNYNAVKDQYQLLEQAAAFYVNSLRANSAGKKAVGYLKSRGVNDELAKAFMLGYAPDEWQALTGRFEPKLLSEAGMAIEKDGRVYDRFRDRIMYPIRDKRGRIVGFGGRVLDDSLPKYLNSPETAVFHKSKEVYGLYELLKKDGKPKRILVVEGYMDVIALTGAGIHYAAATLGTSVSPAHFDLLFRFSSELVLCFDGDNAGKIAAWRAMEPAFGALKDGRQIRIMLLPEEHDPDSLVREEGLERFTERVGRSQSLSDYFFSVLVEGLNLNELEGRSQVVNKAKPYLEKLPQSVFRDMMFAKLNDLAQVNSLDVSKKSARLTHKPSATPKPVNRILPLPRRVLAMLIQYPELIKQAEQKEIIWEDLEFPGINLFQLIFNDILKKKPGTTAVLLEYYRNHPNEKLIKTLASIELFPQVQQLNAGWLEIEFNNGFENLLAQAKKEAEFQKLLTKDKKH